MHLGLEQTINLVYLYTAYIKIQCNVNTVQIDPKSYSDGEISFMSEEIHTAHIQEVWAGTGVAPNG